MPSGQTHPYWSERQTGFPCFRTHRAIDSYAQVMGSKHRVHFHTPLEAMIIADKVEGPHCRGAALNHLAIDEIYADPETKIMFELVRLTDTAAETPDPNSPRAVVRSFNSGFRQQQRRKW
jgi:hypothetical protein